MTDSSRSAYTSPQIGASDTTHLGPAAVWASNVIDPQVLDQAGNCSTGKVASGSQGQASIDCRSWTSQARHA